jgi:MFS family permease
MSRSDQPPSADRTTGPAGARPGGATRTDDRPCVDCLDPSVAVAKPARRLSRPVAFWLIAYAFAVTMLGTTLPTPLYVIFQGQWHFSTSLITLIFASYAVAVLTALLLAGRSSDQVGRRPVLAAAICLSIVSAVTFILATNVGWLFAGRVLSGLSAGLMTGTATAALTETARPGAGRRASLVSSAANLGGLALGPLLAGLLAQYAPDPTVLPFVVQLGLVAAAGLGLLLVPETVSARSALSLRFRGLGIPQQGRAAFIAAGCAGFAAFSLLGLFSALVPTFLVGVLHDTSHAVAGAVVFLAFAVAACIQLGGSRLPTRPVILAGLTVFLAALALIVAGLSAASMPLFLAATVVSGVAVGAVFMGSLATANRLAPAQTRGQVISTYFVFAYVGLTVPVIAVGFGAQAFGDFRATLVVAIALAVIALASMATIRRSAALTRAHRPCEGGQLGQRAVGFGQEIEQDERMDAVGDRAERDRDAAPARLVGQSPRAGEERLGLGRLDEQRRQAGQVRPRRGHQRLGRVGVVDVAGGQLDQRDAVEPRIGVGGGVQVLGRDRQVAEGRDDVDPGRHSAGRPAGVAQRQRQAEGQPAARALAAEQDRGLRVLAG